MSLPVPDAQPPTTVDPTDLIGGPEFLPSLPAAALCGFALPTPRRLGFKFKIPGFALPDPSALLGFLKLPLGINCSVFNPVDVTKGVPKGGGRKSSVPKNPDDDYNVATP